MMSLGKLLPLDESELVEAPENKQTYYWLDVRPKLKTQGIYLLKELKSHCIYMAFKIIKAEFPLKMAFGAGPA